MKQQCLAGFFLISMIIAIDPQPSSLLILSVLCKGFQCLKGFCMFVFTDSTHFCYILNIYIQLLCCLFIKVGDTD